MKGVLKRVGIKYCGGCNPTYERVERVQRLEAAVGSRISLLRHDEPQLDAILVVCGCPKACAAEGLNRPGVQVFTAIAETDLETVIRCLTHLNGSG